MANEALVAFVADVFGLRSAAVSVRSGGSSRHKRLRLEGIDLPSATRILAERMRCLPGAVAINPLPSRDDQTHRRRRT
jgi:hypothetical protein